MPVQCCTCNEYSAAVVHEAGARHSGHSSNYTRHALGQVTSQPRPGLHDVMPIQSRDQPPLYQGWGRGTLAAGRGAPATYPGHCYALHWRGPGLATGVTGAGVTGHCMWSLWWCGLERSRCRTGMLAPASSSTATSQPRDPARQAAAGWWWHTVALWPAHHRL